MGQQMSEYRPDYVLFDIETTGFSPVNDEIIELSAVKVRQGRIVDEFSSLVDPGRPIPWRITQITNIDDSMVAGAPSIEVVLEAFLRFIGDDVLVGHNIHAFDMKFIRRNAETYLGEEIDNDYIDTLKLAKLYMKDLPGHSLGQVSESYGISTTGAHRALNDCRMNQQVFEILGKIMSGETVEHMEIPTCPECGSPLKKRNGRFGEFWGCTGFPTCRFTKNI